YLADEVRQFTADPGNAALLTGRFPEALRGHLDAGLDLRPRNWRHRHLGFLLRQAGDPWARAGAVAALLDPLHVCEVVGDPWERSRVNLCRPGPPAHGAPGSSAADLARELATAQDADEIAWLPADLARLVGAARTHPPAPRPAPRPALPAAPPAPPPAPDTSRLTPGTAPRQARTAPARRRSRWPTPDLQRPEQPFLDDRHQQPSRAVVDPAPGQTPPARGHR